MQYNVGYLTTRYNTYLEAIDKAKKAEREADPAAYEAAEAAKAKKARAAEKAAALPEEEKLALLQEFEAAWHGKDAKTAVPALLRREGKAVAAAVKAYKAA